MNEPIKTDVSTFLKLYAPKEVGVTLVPLSDVEEASESSFWTSLFQSLFFLIAGSVLPLLYTPFDNRPVVILLCCTGILFLLLATTFYIKSNRIRSKIRGHGNPASADESMTERIEHLEAIETSARMFYTIHKTLMRGAPALPKDVFFKRIPEMFTDAIDSEFQKKVFDDMVRIEMIEVFETDSKQLYVKPSLSGLENIGIDGPVTLEKK